MCRHFRVMIAGFLVLSGLWLFFLALSWTPVHAQGGLIMSISGPAQSTAGTVVSYTVRITGTLPGTAAVEYRLPPGFSVQATQPQGTQISPTLWRWDASVLDSNPTIVVTGTHSVVSGCVALHRVSVEDIYSTGQSIATAETATQLTDVLCVYLPVVMR